MKKFLRFLEALLPHLVLILSLVLLTYFVIDQFNEAMAFLANAITKWMLCLFCILTLTLALVSILRKKNDR